MTTPTPDQPGDATTAAGTHPTTGPRIEVLAAQQAWLATHDEGDRLQDLIEAHADAEARQRAAADVAAEKAEYVAELTSPENVAYLAARGVGVDDAYIAGALDIAYGTHDDHDADDHDADDDGWP